MATDDYDEKYTEPELRRKLKEEIQASDKGGKKGQWSARKSQLLVHEYEKHGGGYRGEKDEAAHSLEEWTDQNWQTQGGDTRARQDDGSTKRYLPEKAWDLLSDEEKHEAERKKEQGSKKGEQYVENTLAAKEARRQTTKDSGRGATKQELYEKAQKLGVKGRSAMSRKDLERAVTRAES